MSIFLIALAMRMIELGGVKKGNESGDAAH
jgi:hypothetical protein